MGIQNQERPTGDDISTMTLPFSEIKKPLTAPKPHGISILSQESKEISSISRNVLGKQSKIKPALLPKPDLKSKPKLSAKTPVITSSSVCNNYEGSTKHQDKTDSVLHSSENEISTGKTTENGENLVKAQHTTIKNSCVNSIVDKFQNNIEESIKSSDDKLFVVEDSPSKHNVIIDNVSFQNDSLCSNETIVTKSVNISKIKENFSSSSNVIHKSSTIMVEKQTTHSTSSTASEISNQSSITNLDLKSRIGKFEIIHSKSKNVDSNNKFLKDKKNDTLHLSETKKSLEESFDTQEHILDCKEHDTGPVTACEFKEKTKFCDRNHEENEISIVKSSIEKISKHGEKIEDNSRNVMLSKKVFHEHSCKKSVSENSNIQTKENDLHHSRKNIPLKQDTSLSELNKRTEIPSAEPSFLHRKHSSTLISCTNNNQDINDGDKNESSSIIETKKAFFDKIRSEILSESMTPKKSEIDLLQKKHFSDELWKTKSLGPAMPDVNNERRWSLSSLKHEGFHQSYFTDMFNVKLRSPILNGNESFRNELNNKLKRLSMSKLNDPNNILESKSNDSDPERDFTDNVQGLSSEEPIYWDIEDIVPSKNLKGATDNNNLLDFPSQTRRNHQDDKDFPSDLSDLSDGSDLSNSSWSDIEDISVPIQSTTLHSLVEATLHLTDSIALNNTSVTSNDSNRNLQKPTKSIARKISTSKNSKVKRSASDRSTKSRQEDVESIGSNSTESSYSMTKRLSSWFGSFGKGSKRSSLFYCESSPDQSLLDHTYSNISLEAADKDDIDFTAHPVYANIQDSKPLSAEEVSEKRKRKAFLVAQEVMTSEKVFVDVLSLLCKDLKEQCRSDIPESEIEKFIDPLPQLIGLNEDILKDIKERINHWETLPKISDIFVKKGPFLKLYSPYVQNFEAQCNFFDECCQKYIQFNKKVKEFEVSDFCRKLSVKHYMLKPIQRIPQYRLLLQDYLNHLEPGSVDYEDTQKALQVVCNVADHVNKSMKQGDHLCKLLQIQSQLGNYELIKPGRVFIKEGELYKLSRRGLQERFFILLSDCLLYTSYYGTMTGLRVNYELPLNGMKVCLPQTEDYNNEFSIITVTRSFTLRARSDVERQEWIDALQTAIKENQEHLLSFLNRQLKAQLSNSDLQLGKVAPLWITDSRVSMCQQCTALFTVTFRRHHCRACGRVVCGPCSDYQAPLQYQKFKNSRVCEECFHYLVKEFDNPDSNMSDRIKTALSIEDDQEVKNTIDIIRSNFKKMGTAGSKKSHSKKSRKHMPLRLIEVTANDSGSQMSGWLLKKSGRNWKRCWFVLKEQVLYKYKASEDIAALKSIPVLGYEMETLNELDNFKYVFQLKHQGQDPLVFAVDNEQSYTRWVTAITGATTLS